MTLYANAIDYLDSGMRLIPIHPIINGKCSCGNDHCQAIGKHPFRSNWQNQRLVDSATLDDVWRDVYRCNGLGFALDKDHIVIDVDPRNGGNESLAELQKDTGVDLFNSCHAIVKTGGNGIHFYFKKEDDSSLGWKLPEKYKGIDIKQAGGFVIIAGSLHSSGNHYDWHSFEKSNIENLSIIPTEISMLLKRGYSEHKSAMQSEGMGDVSEISDMLDYIRNDGTGLDYEDWLRIGMSIHNATAGSAEGMAAFAKWSSQSSKFDQSDLDRRWHSFGKRSSGLSTMGTLVHFARLAGWEPKADSNALTTEQLAEIKALWEQKKEDRVSLPSIADDHDIDIFQPPGLLGRINDYVYACSVFPNKSLALACSLSVITNIIGRKYYWPGRFANIQPNLLVLCIAGSSVGKDAVLGAAHRILCSAGLGGAVHGRIKSEKDLLDALERNQYAMYYNDEFGYFLQRLSNAMKKGNASYLEGIIGTIMESFTKGDKFMLIDISRKLAIKERYEELINKLTKAHKDGNFQDEDTQLKKIERAKYLLKKFENGFPNPFLSMFTTATPRTMELAFSGEATENGFLSRALTFHEYETNPEKKPDFAGSPPIPIGLEMTIKNVAFDRDNCPFGRIDSFEQDRVAITVEKEASVFIDRALAYFHDLAETQKSAGLESLPRRALDGVIKICIALSAESRVLTLDMARYAVKLVKWELSKKIQRVNSTEGMASRDTVEKMDGIAHRIIEICSTDLGERLSVIIKNVKSARASKQDVEKIVNGLVENGYLTAIDTGKTYGGLPVNRYKSTGKSND